MDLLRIGSEQIFSNFAISSGHGESVTVSIKYGLPASLNLRPIRRNDLMLFESKKVAILSRSSNGRASMVIIFRRNSEVPGERGAWSNRCPV